MYSDTGGEEGAGGKRDRWVGVGAGGGGDVSLDEVRRRRLLAMLARNAPVQSTSLLETGLISHVCWWLLTWNRIHRVHLLLFLFSMLEYRLIFIQN